MKTFNTLNRALIKRVELLPNVFEFETEKYGIHEYAAIYGIEKILRRTKVTKLLKSEPNYYLEAQHKRLVKYAANGQIAEFNFLSRVILTKSISYRILALNRTMKDWFTMPIRNLRRIWNELSFISRTLSSDLKFKRVWIDKKEGDYARPLGVPTPAWRGYSFMWMNHLETYYKAAGQLQTWQHGGRSGVGVLSCYKQLIPRIKNSNTIFEFDIKGFFDNISHESIIKRFKETLGYDTAQWVASILEARPMKYVLPPKESDIALQKWEQASQDENLREFYPVPSGTVKINYVNLTEEEKRSLIEQEEGLGEFLINQKAEQEREISLGIATRIERGVPSSGPLIDDNPITMDEIWEHLDPEDQAILKEFRNEQFLVDSYGKIMRGERINEAQSTIYSRSENDRELGRDAWKNLGQPGKGVPQGLGTSPFISTFLTDTQLYELGTDQKALIMYMDDGILFAENSTDMENKVKRLRGLLGGIGLELAEEKSKYVKIDGVWKDSLKFLGLRYLPESDTFMSDTRSGTKVQFPSRGDWEDIKNLAALNNTSQYTIRQKFDKLINTQAYEAGLKHGFLGCIIAGSQYKDAPDNETKKEDIRRGQNSAWAQIENSGGFIWKSQDFVNHTEYLTNVSSIATHRFAEFNRKGRKLYVGCRGSRGRKQRV